MSSNTPPPNNKWSKRMSILAAVGAVAGIISAVLAIPGDMKDAINVFSSSDKQATVEPVRLENKQDTKVDISDSVDASSGDARAEADQEVNITVPQADRVQAPVPDNRSSTGNGNQNQSVVVQPAAYPSQSTLTYPVTPPARSIAQAEPAREATPEYTAPTQPVAPATVSPAPVNQTINNSPGSFQMNDVTDSPVRFGGTETNNYCEGGVGGCNQGSTFDMRGATIDSSVSPSQSK